VFKVFLSYFFDNIQIKNEANLMDYVSRKEFTHNFVLVLLVQILCNDLCVASHENIFILQSNHFVQEIDSIFFIYNPVSSYTLNFDSVREIIFIGFMIFSFEKSFFEKVFVDV